MASIGDRQAARIATWGAIVQYVEALLSELADGQFELQPGHNCQVLESTYDEKFSRHLLIYSENMTMTKTLSIVKTLHDRAMGLPADHPDRPLLIWQLNGTVKSVFDTSVYSKCQNMRMAFCNKRGKMSPLRPILESSGDWCAHLVHIGPTVYVPAATIQLDLNRLPEQNQVRSSS